MVLCDCFGVCGRAGDVPAQFFVGGAVAAACGGKFPAVRPARIALGMDAQGAAYRQAQRIPWTAVCAQSRRCAGAGIHAAPAGRIDSAANAGAAMPAGVARCSESAGRAGAERFGESAAHPESCGRTASADGTEPARRKSLLSKAALGIAFCVLAAMLAYDIVTEGVAVGVTKSVGFVLLILVAALGSRLGYLKF